MVSRARVFGMLALCALFVMTASVENVEGENAVPVQRDQVPASTSPPLDAPIQQPQRETPTNPSSGSTLEIAPPPILRGCWAGSSDSDYTVERVGNQAAEWGGKVGSLRLCYQRTGDQFRFTSGKLGLTDYENQQVQNFTNTIKLVSTDGKTWVRLLSQTEDDQTFHRFFITMHVHVSAVAEIYCVIHEERLEVTSKSLNQLDGKPWMLVTWHGFLSRVLPVGEQGVPLPQEEPNEAPK